MSEKSYLMVMVPASPAKTFGKRLLERLEALLLRIDIPEDQVRSELAEMQRQCCGKTNNRTKVGVMNQITMELGFQAPESIDQDFFTDSELHVSRSLYGGPNYTWPGPAAKRLLGERWLVK